MPACLKISDYACPICGAALLLTSQNRTDLFCKKCFSAILIISKGDILVQSQSGDRYEISSLNKIN